MAEMTAIDYEAILNLKQSARKDQFAYIGAVVELIEQQAQEIERLNGCLKFEQNYLSRVGTHGPNCYKWGPGHWDCAMQKIERLQAENEKLNREISELRRGEGLAE